MDYKYAVFIGRFQPFHNGHLQVIQRGLEIAENVLVLVGSANAAASPKNPWSYDDRMRMIYESTLVHPEVRDRRVAIRPLRDYYYNENIWLADIQAKVEEFAHVGEPVCLIGSYKDASSYYLRLFPQWEFQAVQTEPLNATDIRNDIFEAGVGNGLTDWEGKIPLDGQEKAYHVVQNAPVPTGTKQYLDWWITTKTFGDLAGEYRYIKEYKAQWAQSPYPPTFVTTDAVVTCSGHVLVVKRKINPGKGLFALPGGFIKENQFIQDSMLRELREETNIRIDKLILESEIEAEKVFDHPDRSQRGRTISHAYHVKLKSGRLPEVTAADDAAEVMWMPLWDVVKNEHLFFEDHAHIINYFVSQS
jgi:bifunctional NMN adenylyltransferase/nudix hydrolase